MSEEFNPYIALIIWSLSMISLTSTQLILEYYEVSTRVKTVISEIALALPSILFIIFNVRARAHIIINIRLLVGIKYGLLTGILSWYVGGLINSVILYLYPPPESYLEDFRKLLPYSETDLILLLIITLLIVAPAEELLFRGILTSGFLSRYGMVRASILSSLIFALSHLDPWRFGSAMFMGFLSSIIYIKSKTLLAPIFTHTLNNWLVFISFYFLKLYQ